MHNDNVEHVGALLWAVPDDPQGDVSVGRLDIFGDRQHDVAALDLVLTSLRGRDDQTLFNLELKARRTFEHVEGSGRAEGAP
jgi:hypothetical protein